MELGLGWMMDEFDPSMLVRGALDESFTLQRIEAINGGFVRRDLAAKLNLLDERRLAVFGDVALNKIEDCLLFWCEGMLGQRRLRRGKKRGNTST